VNLKPTILAAALIAFGPLAAHAQLVLTVDNPNVVTTPGTVNITGYITNTGGTAASLSSDSFSGPYDVATNNLSVAATWNDDFAGSFLNNIENNGPMALAPGASTADMPLLQVTTPSIGISTYGFYTVNDDVNAVSSNTARVTVSTATTPEFSTIAMMMTGSGGMLLQLARRRSRKA
jgi:hypothetical protein